MVTHIKKDKMKSFESINVLQIYELNGKEEKGLRSDRPKLTVREHWNRKDLIVIQLGEDKVTVIADELKAAIDNAQNAH